MSATTTLNAALADIQSGQLVPFGIFIAILDETGKELRLYAGDTPLSTVNTILDLAKEKTVHKLQGTTTVVGP